MLKVNYRIWINQGLKLKYLRTHIKFSVQISLRIQSYCFKITVKEIFVRRVFVCVSYIKWPSCGLILYLFWILNFSMKQIYLSRIKISTSILYFFRLVEMKFFFGKHLFNFQTKPWGVKWNLPYSRKKVHNYHLVWLKKSLGLIIISFIFIWIFFCLDQLVLRQSFWTILVRLEWKKLVK